MPARSLSQVSESLSIGSGLEIAFVETQTGGTLDWYLGCGYVSYFPCIYPVKSCPEAD